MERVFLSSHPRSVSNGIGMECTSLGLNGFEIFIKF